MDSPIRLAVVGTGIFAHRAYLPAFRNLTDRFQIVAVCSRTPESAQSFAEALPYKAEVVTDYTSILARDDIDAVCLIVPIASLPAMIEAALAAGKHVISEKPVAPDVATARRLLALPRHSVWTVAENWVYDLAVNRAADLIREGKIGRPILCHWAFHIAAHTGRYYTDWRRDNSFPGGFLLDAGVHHIAVLRLLLGEISTVSAFTTSVREDLPPVDTMSATLCFDDGCLGAYTVTYASSSPYPEMLTVLGDQGALKVRLDALDVTGIPELAASGYEQFQSKTIDAELIDFADAVQLGKQPRGTPEQSAQNLAVFEALLRSAETGQPVAPERFV